MRISDKQIEIMEMYQNGSTPKHIADRTKMPLTFVLLFLENEIDEFRAESPKVQRDLQGTN
jgi:hypothetical protein